ncbi:MAG: pectinesterase family protein [Ignavibacteriaceae bacterium]
MKKIAFSLCFFSLWLLCAFSASSQTSSGKLNGLTFFPSDKAQNVNPDTHLEITFNSTPELGTKGKIRIFDMADDRLVDSLDMSIPPGPTVRTTAPKPPYITTPYKYVPGKFTNANTKPGTPSGGALTDSGKYQLTIIGGFTDGFHFYPVIIHNKTATIYLHNNLLQYNKTYYVQIDPGVFKLKSHNFTGISGKKEWKFTTKKSPPPADSKKLIVSTNGKGDFNTVQGAIDFIPDYSPNPVTIFIKNGVYEEIVYFRNKTNITILGEDRDKVVIKYKNREVFNPHPPNISTNEVVGTFPSRRAVFAADHSDRIHIVNLTIRNLSRKAQAEGLLLNGNENIIFNVNIIGSGDALQSNGSAYYRNCSIEGWGDIILGRGPAFFKDCEFISRGGPYMWIRNTSANHGNVFVDCKFTTLKGKETVIARAPTNGGKNYPYCEAVLLNCGLSGISPVGWGPIGGDASNVHYWEYNSTNISDDKPVDISRRLPASRQLTMKKDSAIISDYMKPAYVLGGWKPVMAPVILLQPSSQKVKEGQSAEFKVKVAAIPEASYQWFLNGEIIIGAKDKVLYVNSVSAANKGKYSVEIHNSVGTVLSQEAVLIMK